MIRSIKLLHEMCDKFVADKLHFIPGAKIDTAVAHLRNGQVLVAAGVDTREWLEIHVDVEGEPVIGGVVGDAQADGGDFGGEIYFIAYPLSFDPSLARNGGHPAARGEGRIAALCATQELRA